MFTEEQLLERLHLGLEHDYIAPWFQPVMDPSGVNMHSAEALPRFMDPEFGIISPMTFLDAAHKHGLLAPIGEVLLKKTCAAYAEWDARKIAPGLVTINLTGVELQTEGVVDRITGALNAAGIKPSSLGIETVETTAIEDGCERALASIEEFTSLGVRMIADDLGMAPCDIENLRKLKADAVKLDRMTVSLLGEDDAAFDRIGELGEMTAELGIPLIAKGVETRIQIDLLVEIGCQGQQGFAIARPMPLDSFTEWLDLNTGWDTVDAA